MSMKKFYITTAIPYVNANPHIGFALELVQADALARIHRQLGDDVFFLTGVDENSLKNVQAAEKAGIETRKFVDQNSQRFVDLTKALNISNEDFIRTTSKKHFVGSQKLWSASNQDDIYKKSYKGLYCVGCEQFYTEKELVDGKCPEHLKEPEVVEEENYFFKLSNYQDRLEKLISSDEYKIVPETRKNEVLSFIRSGLEDFSISRSQARARNWGVPVPGDESQVMYVWYDALSNYITGLDYDSEGRRFKKYWPADVHAIGKGIIRFHAIYWPAMLMSANLSLPKTLFVHEYINVDGTKMSKSLGNVVDPFLVIEKYGAEATRYYLLRHINPFRDGDFSDQKFVEAYNADLANGLGNLVSRVSGLIEQNDLKIDWKKVSQAKKDTQVNIKKEFNQIDEFRFDEQLKFIWSLISKVDGDISENKPWELAKNGQADRLSEVLTNAVADILLVGEMLIPYLPETAEKIQKIFEAKKIKKVEALFPRLK